MRGRYCGQLPCDRGAFGDARDFGHGVAGKERGAAEAVVSGSMGMGMGAGMGMGTGTGN